MRCSLCHQEGANSSGFHPHCFTQKIKTSTSTSSTKFNFGTGQVTREERVEPGDLEDWEERLEKERRKIIEEREESERIKRENAQRAEKAREEQAKNWQPGGSRPFSSFFSGFGMGGYGTRYTPPVNVDQLMIIDSVKVMKLLRLCHPDKHENSELSTEVTKWLLEIKAKLDA